MRRSRRVLFCVGAWFSLRLLFFLMYLIFRVSREEGKKEGDFEVSTFKGKRARSPPPLPSPPRTRSRMIPNALHKPFYTVRCSCFFFLNNRASLSSARFLKNRGSVSGTGRNIKFKPPVLSFISSDQTLPARASSPTNVPIHAGHGMRPNRKPTLSFLHLPG